MSYRIQPLVWRAQLTSTTKLVLLRMADHATDTGESIYPSIPSLAKACGLKDRAVQNSIRRLREVGAIVEVQAADFASRRPVEYRIDLVRLEALSVEPIGCAKDTGALNAPVHKMREPVSLTTASGVLNAPKSFIEPSIKSLSEEGGAIAPAAEFAWQGNVIRLKRSDYDKWRRSYPNIHDFDAELQAADDYYLENPPPDGKWFFPVSKWLKRTNASPDTRPRAAWSLKDEMAKATATITRGQ